MTQIPAPTVSMEDMVEWDRLKKELAKLKQAEHFLRMKIYRAYFPNPKEGTNKVPLNAGYKLKLSHTIDRKFDEGVLQAATQPGGLLAVAGFDANPLVKWKPELVLPAYRLLTDEQRTLFDHVLIIKPGSPQMEIVLPAAEAKRQAEAAAAAPKE